jgi:surfactin synthase thioesterase subunit
VNAGLPSGEWWWWPGPVVPRERPVLFFPPSGADQTVVTPLLPHLSGVRLGVLRLPGRGARADEPAPTDLALLAEQVADAVLAVPGTAPLLVGHSFGAVLAYTVAHVLTRRGRPPARLVVVTATAPRAWRRRIRALAGDETQYVARRTGELLGSGGVPAEVVAHPELAEATWTTLATDVRLAYQAVELSSLGCPLTVVRARDDALVAAVDATPWYEATRADVDEVVVTGGHFFYRDRPVVLAQLLRGELAQLDGAYHAN